MHGLSRALFFVLVRCDELVLAADEVPLQWVLASRGAECETACSQLGRYCDEEAWPQTLDAWEAVARSTPGLLCKGTSAGGWQYNPSICTENWLLSARGGMCFWQGGPGARCSGGLEDFQTEIAQRICPCRKEEEEKAAAVTSASLFSLDAATVASRIKVREPFKMPSAVASALMMLQGGTWIWIPQPSLQALSQDAAIADACVTYLRVRREDWSEDQRSAHCRLARVRVAGGFRRLVGMPGQAVLPKR
eukprot:TRINITY_DN34354_c0_g1_i2.p1 TRINITY_DN34354_c0_g1~~TRINITY_DN34354_c0_g1_i2.p1  ORF type:complete len:249 (-),score=43.56 TRINITY_DN34354_c0_g1_i2:58-804(-)